jgi:hypothetical protein
MAADLVEPLVEAIDNLQCLRVRKREVVRSQSDHVAMLLVEGNVGYVGAATIDVNETPPVRQRGQGWAWVLVEAIVVTISHKPSGQEREPDRKPVLPEYGDQRIGNPVHLGDGNFDGDDGGGGGDGRAVEADIDTLMSS